jgi:hypothetical protein
MASDWILEFGHVRNSTDLLHAAEENYKENNYL